MPQKNFGPLAAIDPSPLAGDEFTALDTQQKFTCFVDGTFVEDGIGVVVFGEIPGGVIDGVNDTFTLANTPNGNISLKRNGLGQTPGAGNDYQLSGLTITFEAAAIPKVGDTLRVSYKF